MEVIDVAYGWVQANPEVATAIAVAVVVLLWLLRRPDPVLAQGNKDADRLTERNRGKYDKLRSLK